MNVIYHAYSIDFERKLGSFDATEHERDPTGANYDQWCKSLNEKSVRIVNWEDRWFQTIDESAHMSELKVEQLPKDLQMRLLIGAMP